MRCLSLPGTSCSCRLAAGSGLRSPCSPTCTPSGRCWSSGAHPNGRALLCCSLASAVPSKPGARGTATGQAPLGLLHVRAFLQLCDPAISQPCVQQLRLPETRGWENREVWDEGEHGDPGPLFQSQHYGH
ncbi:hypothetical protein DV515_00012553, partial [Chloebia gouldiae]